MDLVERWSCTVGRQRGDKKAVSQCIAAAAVAAVAATAAAAAAAAAVGGGVVRQAGGASGWRKVGVWFVPSCARERAAERVGQTVVRPRARRALFLEGCRGSGGGNPLMLSVICIYPWAFLFFFLPVSRAF